MSKKSTEFFQFVRIFEKVIWEHWVGDATIKILTRYAMKLDAMKIELISIIRRLSARELVNHRNMCLCIRALITYFFLDVASAKVPRITYGLLRELVL